MNEHFPRWFCDDAAAIEFATQIWQAMQKWDDVIDDGATQNANEVFQYLVFRMQWQPFFNRYEQVIRPLLLDMFLSWRDATAIEKSGDAADLEKAFMLRAGVYRLYSVMAWLLGGDAHSVIVGPEIHRAYGERLATYIEEHSHA